MWSQMFVICEFSIMAPHPQLLSSSSVSVFKKSLKIQFYSIIHVILPGKKKGYVFYFTMTIQDTALLCSMFEAAFVLMRHAASNHQGPLLDQEQTVKAQYVQ